MNIHFYPDELDYVNAKLHLRAAPQTRADESSFLGTFLLACMRADFENYELLRPALAQLMEKYPADPVRLAMERHDSKRDLPGDAEIIRKAYGPK